MAPLPPNNTERWFVDYAVEGVNHTLLLRTEAPSDAATVSAFVDDLWSALTSNLFSTVINGLRKAAQGSDISLDQTYTGTTSFGGGDPGEGNKPAFIAFQGRSEGGRPVKLTIFGYKDLGTVDDYRFVPGVGSTIADAQAVIQTTAGFPCAIDANNVIWKTYVNCGFNAYWQRQARKT